MILKRTRCANPFFLLVLALLFPACPRSGAQAALLMAEPFGLFGFLNPTGHDAVYFHRICAETPVKLRRCAPGERGAVITRYQGIAEYDWIAMPLLPYLYAVENASEVPVRADPATVTGLRDKYHEARLQSLGKDVPRGGNVKRGWSQFVGVAYDRRVYAFRFATTEEQDDALIAQMNSGPNHYPFQSASQELRGFQQRHSELLFSKNVSSQSPFGRGHYNPKASHISTAELCAQAP